MVFVGQLLGKCHWILLTFVNGTDSCQIISGVNWVTRGKVIGNNWNEKILFLWIQQTPTLLMNFMVFNDI